MARISKKGDDEELEPLHIDVLVVDGVPHYQPSELHEVIGNLPNQPWPGFLLCHNHVRHGPTTRLGTRGFRAWYETKPLKGFVVCPCGWAPDAGRHYALADHVATYRKKRSAPRRK